MWKGKYQSMNNIKYGKGKGKLLPNIKEITAGKAHTNLIEIFRWSQQSFSIRRE